MPPKKEEVKFTVIRDTREQEGWIFQARARCLGTEVQTLSTGDYTVKGFEKVFCLERKFSSSEFCQNLFQPRFHRELERLDEFEHPYLFLEFEWKQLVEYPRGSGVPPSKWRSLKVRPDLLIKTYHEMRLAHPRLRVEFVGQQGRTAALSLFKRIVDLYGSQSK
jgi:hypothetical protein